MMCDKTKQCNKNIATLLKKTVTDNWDKDWLIDSISGQRWSYQSFLGAMMSYVSVLKNEFGLKENDTLCILQPNSVELVILYFAALAAGIVVAPIDILKGPYEIEELLDQLRPSLLITAQNCSYSSVPAVSLDRFYEKFPKKVELHEALTIFDSIDYNKLYLITFTSGSTGSPKGVMHSFANLAQSAFAFKEVFNFGPDNIFYHNLPMSYMAGILNLIILPFISGAKIVVGQRFSIDKVAFFWDEPIRFLVNTFWFVPTILSLLLRFDRGIVGMTYARRTKIIGCVGTAPLSDELKDAFESKYGINLYQSYGLSETLFVTTNAPGSSLTKNSVGKCLDGVSITFDVDEEILINVPWMFLGYLGDVSKVDIHFRDDGCYRSGDLGVFSNEGFLIITGRKKDLIIKGGINISPKRIDDLINKMNVFDEAIVIGLPDTVVGEKIACFYTSGNTLCDESVKQVQRCVVGNLGKNYAIDIFVKVDEIPKNLSGKVDKIKLKKRFEHGV